MKTPPSRLGSTPGGRAPRRASGIASVVLAAAVTALAGLVAARPAAAAIPDSERQALLDLYASTNGAQWTTIRFWGGAPGTECTWFGVICDAGQTTVQQLNLGNNNLVGPFPTAVANLPSLTDLDLSRNHLTGSIPSALGSLASLRTVKLFLNQLSGPIPSELGNLSNLQVLNLHTNQLTGPIPPELTGLPELTTLILTLNQLTGPIPADLAKLTKLTTFAVEVNHLTGGVSPALGSLANLQFLQLNGNQLSGPIPPELGNLTQLVWLHLASNQLTGPIPTQLGNLPRLDDLDLSYNQLTGPIPPEFGNLTQMRHAMALHHNQLSGPIPPELGNLVTLNKLDLSYNSLTGPIPATLGNMGNFLQSLYLQDNRLSGPLPGELGNLAYLLQLAIRSNQLVGEVPSSITKLTNLIGGSNDFRWNGLHTSDPAVARWLSYMQYNADWQGTQTVPVTALAASAVTPSSVTLTWTPIPYTADSGRYEIYYATRSGGPYTLSGATADKTAATWTVTGLAPDTPYWFVVKSLTDPHANNQDTVVSDPSAEVSARTAPAPPPPAISAAERQALVDLFASTGGSAWTDRSGWGAESGSECGWYGVVCDAGGTTVARLLLNGNNLAGALPATIGNLAGLQALDLSSNALTGPVPAEIGALLRLATLRLGGNRLAGSIPAQLGSLANLQTLDLSGNALTGAVPVELGALSSLRTLDLGGNGLSGALPGALGSLAALEVLGLASNALVGEVPAAIVNLRSLAGGRSAFGWNGLHTPDAAVAAFLSDKQAGGDGEGTQTVPVTGLAVASVTSASVTLAWSPIRYAAGAGAYRVYVATTPGGPYDPAGATADKGATGLTVTGLAPDTTYYLVVRSLSQACANNANAVESDASAEVSARTDAGAVGSKVRRHLKHAP